MKKTGNSAIDYEVLLMQQLSRRHMEHVAHCIGDNEKEFERLMAIVLHGREPVVQRAAWAMDACLKIHPKLLLPYVETLIAALPRFGNNGTIRQVVKALAVRDIPEKLEGQAVDLCFRWLQSSATPVAVKVHCMQILANITVQHPDLAVELRTVISGQMPRNSAGFASRGRKILKQLQNEIHVCNTCYKREPKSCL
ncbi:MAG: hypothetical protein LBL04_12925 [Bacteroidales bacterium]|nr:hypothetical protein [Bacteroidales bacterium]